MLRKDKEGYYIIDSLDKLAEWHELTKEIKPIQPKPKTKKKTKVKTKTNKFF
jgi:hypothetical protein